MNDLIGMNYYLFFGTALLLGALPYIIKSMFKDKVKYSLKHPSRYIISVMVGFDLILIHIILSLHGLMVEFSKTLFYFHLIWIIFLKAIFITYGVINVLETNDSK